MLDKKTYANGQQIYEIIGEELTFFYKNGSIKAKGQYLNGLLNEKWIFYRETGQLWQIGHFNMGKKNGLWIRFNKENIVEYEEIFIDDKKQKK